ncbi:MAG: hypothetical protein KBD46_03025 [Candidatus Levybacteria bacterium]|nr:hypothetical protein [Candidatus Levybacteria bacterium]
MKFKKIYIVGGQGSGKTTFAVLLSAKLGIRHIDLDILRQPGDKKTKRTISERIPYVQELAGKKEWIAEGIYITWVTDLLEQADVLIYLDIPAYVTIPRVIVRYFKRKIRGKDKYGFLNEMSLVKDIFKYHTGIFVKENSNEDRDITKKKTIQTLQKYVSKTVIIKNTKQSKEYLEKIV